MVVIGTDWRVVFAYGDSGAAWLLSPDALAYWQRERMVAGPRRVQSGCVCLAAHFAPSCKWKGVRHVWGCVHSDGTSMVMGR